MSINKKLKFALQYIVSLGVATGLLWYVYRGQDVEVLLSQLSEVNYFWVIVSVFLAIVSHVLRAYRWNLLLKPLGYTDVTTLKTTLAVFIGYFSNLVIPRMGEVTRCSVLKKTNNIPVTTSLGSVVAERAFDFIGLLLFLLLTVLLAFQKIALLLGDLWKYKLKDLIGNYLSSVIILIAVVSAIIALVFIVFKHRIRKSNLYNKVLGFFKSLLVGIKSFKKIEQKKAFGVSTIAIWVLYFFMTYLMFFAIEETKGISLIIGLSTFTMGGLGMVAPVQGGTGTYHGLVVATLVAYGISEGGALLYAGLVHAIQTLLFILMGIISAFVLFLINKKENTKLTVPSK